METEKWAIALAAFCALLGSLGQVLFKVGSSSVEATLRSWLTNTRILGGMALYASSAILFIIALRHGSLSVLYPVIATSYVWVTLIANRVLGEAVSVSQWVGIGLILAGVALVARR